MRRKIHSRTLALPKQNTASKRVLALRDTRLHLPQGELGRRSDTEVWSPIRTTFKTRRGKRESPVEMQGQQCVWRVVLQPVQTVGTQRRKKGPDSRGICKLR